MAEHIDFELPAQPSTTPLDPQYGSNLTPTQHHHQQHPRQQHPQQQHPQQQHPQKQHPQPNIPATSAPSPENDTTSTAENSAKSGYRRLHTEKAVATLSAGLLSILVIALSYVAIFASAEIYRTTIAPLTSASILIFAAIVSSCYLCSVPGTMGKLAALPIIFSIVGGAMIVLLNAASKALNDGGFVRLNQLATLLSAGVFGGLGLGSTLGFVLFAGVEEWRFPV